MGIQQESEIGRNQKDIPGMRYVDYRNYPTNLFTEAMVVIEGTHLGKYGVKMSEAQTVVCKQALSIWMVCGENPFAFKDPYRTRDLEKIREGVDIHGVRVSRVSIKVWLDEMFQDKDLWRKGKREFLKRQIERSAGIVIREHSLVRDEIDSRLAKREDPYLVKGDPEHTDPRTGVSGVGATNTFFGREEESTRGLGYVQGQIDQDERWHE